jgi:DNA-binding CsgD family transcriptional regulator
MNTCLAERTTQTPPPLPLAWDLCAPQPWPASAEEPSIRRLLRQGLDCVDYPMLCLKADRGLWWANSAGHRALSCAGHPLWLDQGRLRLREGWAWEPLHRALREAFRLGRRRLVVVGEAGDGAWQLSASVVPLRTAPDDAPAIPAGSAQDEVDAVLLMLGRRHASESLSTDWYARDRGFTPAETRVLQGLMDGLQPSEIAERQSVALSTVRTQLRSVRAKAGAANLRELLRQVAVLPPVPGVV